MEVNYRELIAQGLKATGRTSPSKFAREVEKDTQTIYKWLNGKSVPSLPAQQAMVRLGVLPSWVLFGESPMVDDSPLPGQHGDAA